MTSTYISVILTGYNEGPQVYKNLEVIKSELEKIGKPWEMILIDDKSKDDTPAAFKLFQKEHPKNVVARFHTVNRGRGATVAEGIKIAKGKIVGYIDTDLELSPTHIKEFANAIDEGVDIVVAKRYFTTPDIDIVRAVAREGYRFVIRLLLSDQLIDAQAGFKMFNREKILKVVDDVESTRWFFDTEILARSLDLGYSIKYIPVEYKINRDKKTSLRFFSDAKVYILSLLKYRFLSKRRG